MRYVALSFASLFAACIVTLHYLRPDISPVQRGMSRYADGRTRQQATVAFLALAASLLALSQISAGKPWFLAAAAALVGAALTPMQLEGTPRPVAALHATAAVVFYPSLTLAMFAARPSSRLPPLMLGALSAFVAAFVVPSPWRIQGLLQRVFFVLALAGIASVALAP